MIWTKLGLFAGGLLFGTAGLKILGSKDAKNVYAQTAAAVMRAKDGVMSAATKVKEGCDDVLADAKDINEKRAAEAETVEDCSTVVADEADKADEADAAEEPAEEAAE